MQWVPPPLGDHPNLVSPKWNEVATGRRVTFQWDTVDGATKYYLQVLRLSDGDVGNVIEYIVANFPNKGTDYKFRVVVGNSAGLGN